MLDFMVYKDKNCSVIKQARMIVCNDCTIIITHNLLVNFQLSALVVSEKIIIFRKQLKYKQLDE